MNNVNVNKTDTVKLIKSFIKDLSFENPQNINEHNSINNNNNNININTNVLFKPYKNNFFSLNVIYNLDCSSKQIKKKLFNLELEYFGFFEILENKNLDKKFLTESGIKLLFPYIKEIIEYITQKGGSMPILLNEIDFDLKKVNY